MICASGAWFAVVFDVSGGMDCLGPMTWRQARRAVERAERSGCADRAYASETPPAINKRYLFRNR